MSKKDEKKSENKKLVSHTRLFNRVMAIPKKKMSQAEKVMLCYIISYVVNGQVFDLDNKYIAKVLGDSIQSVTDYITRLESMGLIQTEYKRTLTESGYFGTKRYITVVNLNGWTLKDSLTPNVPLIPKKNKKKTQPVAETVTSTEKSEKKNIQHTDNQIPEVEVQVAEPTKEIPFEVSANAAVIPDNSIQQKTNVTDFDVNTYLTPVKLEWIKQFEKGGETFEMLKDLDRKTLDDLFYGNDGVMCIKSGAKGGIEILQNIHQINYRYVGGSRITLYIDGKDGKAIDSFQIEDEDYNQYLNKNGIGFGGIAHDDFTKLKQYQKQSLKMY